MNNFAITSAGIGDALQRSASALYEAGNTIDESVALVTAANSVIQNPEQVGTALKTLALRLRGAKTELEDASLDTENMAENTAQLQAKLKALTHGKVDIMLNADTFKSTTQILREMSAAWEEMTDIERSAALELMGGKRQANILASVIKNFETVEDVIETSANSAGSALAENETHLDSIQGKTELLTNSLQTMWNNALSSDFIKKLLDIANGFVKIIDKAGLLNTVLTALFAASAFKKDGLFGHIFKAVDGSIKFNTAEQGIKGIASALFGVGQKAQWAAIGVKALNTALTTIGVGLVAIAITAFVKILDKLIVTTKETAEAAREAANVSKELREEFKTLDDYKEQIKELRTELDSNTLSESEAYDAREKLLSIQNELIDKFGLEKDGINLVTGAINDQIAAVDALAQKEAQQWLYDNQKEINEAIEFFKDDKQGGKLDSFWENDKTSITNWGSSKNVSNWIDEYVKNREHMDTWTYFEGQDINFTGSVEEVKTEVEDFQKWLDGKEEELNNQIGNIKAKQIDGSLGYSDSIATNILNSLNKDLKQLQDIREKIGKESKNWFGSDSLYASNKALMDQVKLNTAMTDYADQYMAILEAENDLAEAQAKGDQEGIKQALDTINAETSAAAKTAEANGQNYMVSFFNGIKDGYEKQINLFNLEDALTKGTHDFTLQGTLDTYFAGMNAEEILQLEKIDSTYLGFDNLRSIANAYGLELQDLIDTLVKLGYLQSGFATEADKLIHSVKSYTTLVESLEKYNEIMSATSDIVINNTEVTEEYKESLKELGISETDLAKCFDDTNPLVVTNAEALNNLVKSAKNNISNNAKLAKSQARLQYYKLYKEMKQLTNGTKVTDDATRDYIDSLYDQMNLLEKTISKYSILEGKLLGAANAYNKLEEAQAADEAMDYGSKAENLVNVLGDAINSRQLGTAAAQVAVEGLIPDSWFADLETAGAKMQAIYEYFTQGPISQLFTIEFDDEGAITSVDMTEENIKKYIDSSTIFNGTWDNFTLDPAIDSMEDFMAATNMTEEMAFAFLTELEKYDISWLDGQYGTLMDQLMGDDLEYNIQKVTEQLADLEMKIAKGTITADELNQYNTLTNSLSEFGDVARQNISVYNVATDKMNEYKESLADYRQQLDDGIITEKEYAEKVADITTKMNNLSGLMREIEPAELEIQLAIDDVQEDIKNLTTKLEGKYGEFKIDTYFDFDEKSGKYTVKTEYQNDEDLVQLANYLTEEHALQVTLGEGITTVEEHLADIVAILEQVYDIVVQIDDSGIWSWWKDFSAASLTKKISMLWDWANGNNETEVNGTANVHGSAYAGGNWGAQQSETALVGELGAEMRVRGNRWELIGENGAEFTDVKKGDIIFNHKQTEELLKNGHVFSRGKAYAGGTIKTSGSAYAYTIGTTVQEDEELKKQQREQQKLAQKTRDAVDAYDKMVEEITTLIKGTATQPALVGVVTNASGAWGNTDADLDADYGNSSGDGSAVEDLQDEFEEVFDWVAVRLEELNEDLNLLGAQLDNAIDYSGKETIIDKMIAKNKELKSNLEAGMAEYQAEADKVLATIDSSYHDMVKDGSIDIEEFYGEVDEGTYNAIQEYRKWAQQVADLNLQLEQTETTIRNFAMQKVDEAEAFGSAKVAIEDRQNEQLRNAVDYLEASGYIPDEAYYTAMMANTNEKIDHWSTALIDAQNAFDEGVASGEIVEGSQAWYEGLETLYDIRSNLDAAELELEEFQNAINQIYWDNFDELINRLDYVQSETQGLIDLMSHEDMFVTPEGKTYEGGIVKYWAAEDVEWTNEGIATMGLYAQQMEMAEYRAQQYAEAISKLNADYAAGKYSESEYLAELNKLQEAQYDSIEAYYDARDAIVELNKKRFEAIKDGIEKEIDAYSELIAKKKELLNSEKDLYNFEKSIQESEKNIAEINRQLAALENDNSMAAAAERKRLKAELAEAEYELEEKYIERSYEDNQNALDQEEEDFKAEKDAEIAKWEEYFANVDLIITDSLNLVQANATGVYDTLNGKATEYGLILNEAVLTPWKDTEQAIGDYDKTFGDTISANMDQLELLKQKWEAVINLMKMAGGTTVGNINKANDRHTAAHNPVDNTETDTQDDKSNTGSQTGDAIIVGGTINAGNARIYSSADGTGGGKQYFASDPTYTVLQEKDGYVLVRHSSLSSGATGWFKKTDIQAHATGTKGVKDDELAWIDELGDELVLHADGNGRLAYLTKGTAVIPHDISENLMTLGQLDPSDVLARNTPQIGISPSVVNNTVELNMSIAEVVHIDEVTKDTIPDLTKAIEKQLDKYMKEVNNNIRKYAR